MRRFWFGLAAVTLVLFPQAQARAWNAVGHMAIARIAYGEMDRDLQARLDKLLQAHPHYRSFLIAARPDGVSEREWAFMRASIWPDWVRSKFPGVIPEPNTFNSPPEHYVNLPFIKPADKDLLKLDEDKLREKLPRENVLTSLERRVTLAGSDAEKAINLCWALHLIGDLHQPLHAVSFYCKELPDGDRGGNLIGIRTKEGGYNLHAYWDDLMGRDPAGAFTERDNVEYQTKLFKLVTEAVERLRDPRYGREKFADQLGKTKFADWADESLELAKTVAYCNAELKFVVIKFSGSFPPDAPELSEEYDKKAHEVGHRRVALAAHRLADRLKDLLARP
jgi:hypothetical protein